MTVTGGRARRKDGQKSYQNESDNKNGNDSAVGVKNDRDLGLRTILKMRSGLIYTRWSYVVRDRTYETTVWSKRIKKTRNRRRAEYFTHGVFTLDLFTDVSIFKRRKFEKKKSAHTRQRVESTAWSAEISGRATPFRRRPNTPSPTSTKRIIGARDVRRRNKKKKKNTL